MCVRSLFGVYLAVVVAGMLIDSWAFPRGLCRATVTVATAV